MKLDVPEHRYASLANEIFAGWDSNCRCPVPGCGAPGVQFRNGYEAWDWSAGPTHAEFICGARVETPSDPLAEPRLLVACNPVSRGAIAWGRGKDAYAEAIADRAVRVERSKVGLKRGAAPGAPRSHEYAEEFPLPGVAGWKCRRIALSYDLKNSDRAPFALVSIEQWLLQRGGDYRVAIAEELERLRFRTRGLSIELNHQLHFETVAVAGLTEQSRLLFKHEGFGVFAPGLGGPTTSSKWISQNISSPFELLRWWSLLKHQVSEMMRVDISDGPAPVVVRIKGKTEDDGVKYRLAKAESGKNGGELYVCFPESIEAMKNWPTVADVFDANGSKFSANDLELRSGPSALLLQREIFARFAGQILPDAAKAGLKGVASKDLSDPARLRSFVDEHHVSIDRLYIEDRKKQPKKKRDAYAGCNLRRIVLLWAFVQALCSEQEDLVHALVQSGAIKSRRRFKEALNESDRANWQRQIIATSARQGKIDSMLMSELEQIAQIVCAGIRAEYTFNPLVKDEELDETAEFLVSRGAGDHLDRHEFRGWVAEMRKDPNLPKSISQTLKRAAPGGADGLEFCLYERVLKRLQLKLLPDRRATSRRMKEVAMG